MDRAGRANPPGEPGSVWSAAGSEAPRRFGSNPEQPVHHRGPQIPTSCRVGTKHTKGTKKRGGNSRGSPLAENAKTAKGTAGQPNSQLRIKRIVRIRANSRGLQVGRTLRVSRDRTAPSPQIPTSCRVGTEGHGAKGPSERLNISPDFLCVPLWPSVVHSAVGAKPPWPSLVRRPRLWMP